MKPYIFMDDFERAEWGDSVYSMIGRALTLATSFENSCRSLSMLLDIKEAGGEVLASPSSLEEFAKKAHKHLLGKHITSIAQCQDDFRRLLDKGRCARNEIAHEIASGIEDENGLSRKEEYLTERIRELSMALAEAERAVCFALTAATHDHLPTNDFLKSYPEAVTKWVCSKE